LIQPNRIEIQRLFAVAQRELADAAVVGISSDGSFEHAYAAALTLATAALRADGHRIHGPDHHRQTFDGLRSIAGEQWRDAADYFQQCRKRRNVSAYDQVGTVSTAEATDLRKSVAEFAAELRVWLKEAHPEIAPG